MYETMSWEDWMAGRRARRETGLKVAPEIIRRPAGSKDHRLRKLFGGERGLPFTPTDQLPDGRKAKPGRKR
jgi:hypothetical protein